MAQIARLKCPFLSRLPKGFTQKAGSSLLSYSENCPVMTELMSHHISTKSEEHQEQEAEKLAKAQKMTAAGDAPVGSSPHPKFASDAGML